MRDQRDDRPSLVVASLAQRRPKDLVVGEVGRCEIHSWPSAWRRPDGQLWCERCWWQSPEGGALARYLNDLPAGALPRREQDAGREPAK